MALNGTTARRYGGAGTDIGSGVKTTRFIKHRRFGGDGNALPQDQRCSVAAGYWSGSGQWMEATVHLDDAAVNRRRL